MMLSLLNLFRALVGPRKAKAAARPKQTARLQLVALEERFMPSSLIPSGPPAILSATSGAGSGKTLTSPVQSQSIVSNLNRSDPGPTEDVGHAIIPGRLDHVAVGSDGALTASATTSQNWKCKQS